MMGILRKLANEGTEFTKSDVAALSQYMTRHIKRFDNYVIDLKDVPEPMIKHVYYRKRLKSS